jgi:uncharacterized NAD-dependent epimerase/dehydratase family protein
MTAQQLQHDFPAPFLVYLGDVEDMDSCKTGSGIADWAGERALGQYRSSDRTASVGLRDLSIEQAVLEGAKSLLVGIAGVGGYLEKNWHDDLLRAARAGLNIVSGGHQKLIEIPGLAEAAQQANVELIEIRNPPLSFPIGTGLRRPGRRLLTVGTDCALGKKYTALSIAAQLRGRGVEADFRASGQTGIMITGGGIAIDSIVSDFVAGAAEALSPDADPDHWDIIEGQGSLIHPGYAAVTLGLLHGSQPDEIVLCHDPRRLFNLDSPQVKIPPLMEVVQLYLSMGRLTNPQIRCAGISLNTRGMTDKERAMALARERDETGLIVFDPVADGIEEYIDYLVATC